MSNKDISIGDLVVRIYSKDSYWIGIITRMWQGDCKVHVIQEKADKCCANDFLFLGSNLCFSENVILKWRKDSKAFLNFEKNKENENE